MNQKNGVIVWDDSGTATILTPAFDGESKHLANARAPKTAPQLRKLSEDAGAADALAHKGVMVAGGARR